MAKIKGSITVFPARAGVIQSLDGRAGGGTGLSRTSGGDPERQLYIAQRP